MDEHQGALALTSATDSRELSTDLLDSLRLPADCRLDLDALPERLSDDALILLRAIAEAPLVPWDAGDRTFFDKCMRSLAILPRKADDEVKGKLRLELYWRKLQGYPHAALGWMVEAGLDRFDWFPSIHQCIDLLKEWPGANNARAWRVRAKRRLEDEYAARYRDLIDGIRDGTIDEDAINALSDRMKARLDCDMVIICWRAEPGGPLVCRVRHSAPFGAAESGDSANEPSLQECEEQIDLPSHDGTGDGSGIHTS
jgi:hypothetical protein